MTASRLAKGGLVNRGRPLNFTFDGQDLKGFDGDTLASALLANDRMLVGRSFKYHRPRGIVTAGASEPNALVTIGTGGRTEPNTGQPSRNSIMASPLSARTAGPRSASISVR